MVTFDKISMCTLVLEVTGNLCSPQYKTRAPASPKRKGFYILNKIKAITRYTLKHTQGSYVLSQNSLVSTLVSRNLRAPLLCFLQTIDTHRLSFVSQ
jgi:hypothetical protein